MSARPMFETRRVLHTHDATRSHCREQRRATPGRGEMFGTMKIAMVRCAIAPLQIDADKNRRKALRYRELKRAKIANGSNTLPAQFSC